MAKIPSLESLLLEHVTPIIFISATTTDLAAARKAMERAIDSIGGHGRTMEHLQNQPSTEIAEKLAREIRRCDGVLHLAGLFFGSEPRPSAKPRRSYTQMEYDLAIALQKPCSCFVAARATFDFDLSAVREHQSDRAFKLQGLHRAALLRSGMDTQEVATTHELEKAILAMDIEPFRRAAARRIARKVRRGARIAGKTAAAAAVVVVIGIAAVGSEVLPVDFAVIGLGALRTNPGALRAELVERTAQLAVAREEATSAEAGRAALAQTVDQMNVLLADAQREAAAVYQGLATAQGETSRARAEFAALAQTVDVIRGQLADAQQEATALRAGGGTVGERMLALEKKLTEAQAAVARLEGEKGALVARLAIAEEGLGDAAQAWDIRDVWPSNDPTTAAHGTVIAGIIASYNPWMVHAPAPVGAESWDIDWTTKIGATRKPIVSVCVFDPVTGRSTFLSGDDFPGTPLTDPAVLHTISHRAPVNSTLKGLFPWKGSAKWTEWIRKMGDPSQIKSGQTLKIPEQRGTSTHEPPTTPGITLTVPPAEPMLDRTAPIFRLEHSPETSEGQK